MAHTAENGLPPVRLCCGQRHHGPVCPDGMVMCCICFERRTVEQLNVLPDGTREDVCKACAEYEATRDIPSAVTEEPRDGD